MSLIKKPRQGEQGIQGVQGEQGIQGVQGEQGIPGINGTGSGDMLKVTYDTVGDGIVNKARALSDVTADPTTSTAYSLTGSVTQFFSWVTKRFEEATGYAWGTTIVASLKKLWELTDTKSALIPTGFTYDLFRADRSQTYSYLWVDCHDSAGAPRNPTSLVITMYVNGALVYTSSAITTATFTATIALTIATGDLVRVVTSNTTGLTGGVLVSPRMVNR